jgi:hypothetical protein
VIPAREFMQLWKIWPRVEESLFSVLGRKNTLHLWGREEIPEGINCTSGANCTKVYVEFFVHVHDL